MSPVVPTTLEALIIIALVIAPGFVLATFASRVTAFGNQTSDLRFLLPTITAGTIVHVLLSPWTVRLVDFYDDRTLRAHNIEVVLWGVVTLLIVPASLGIFTGWLSNTRPMDRMLDGIGLGYVDRMPNSWEYVMRLQRAGFVRIHLKDGEIIGGRYSGNSFAGSAEGSSPDLYLEDVWRLNDQGDFERSLLDNWGVWVAADTMQYVEFFNDLSWGGTNVTDNVSSSSRPAVRQRQARTSTKDIGRDEPTASNSSLTEEGLTAHPVPRRRQSTGTRNSRQKRQ